MTPLAIVTIFVLCALLVFVIAVRSRRRHGVQHLVDINAFQVLVDRDDENFLRAKLSRKVFIRLKRQRIRVTWGYVERMAQNARVALRDGETMRLDENPRIVEQAVRSIELASQIRMQCLVAFGKMAVEFAFPSLQLTPAHLVAEYESLRDSVARLASLQPQGQSPVTIAI